MGVETGTGLGSGVEATGGIEIVRSNEIIEQTTVVQEMITTKIRTTTQTTKRVGDTSLEVNIQQEKSEETERKVEGVMVTARTLEDAYFEQYEKLEKEEAKKVKEVAPPPPTRRMPQAPTSNNSLCVLFSAPLVWRDLVSERIEAS